MGFERVDDLGFAILQYLFNSGKEVRQASIVREVKSSPYMDINQRRIAESTKRLEKKSLVYIRKENRKTFIGITPEGEEKYLSEHQTRYHAPYILRLYSLSAEKAAS